MQTAAPTMKLTIEIPDAHTGAVLEYVAELIAKTSAVTDHPELPLDDESNIRWAAADIDAADPLKVAMDDQIEIDRSSLPRLTPEVGKTYWTRHGLPMAIKRISSNGDFYAECAHGPFYYHPDGEPRASALTSPDYDLVEECPF